MQAVVLCGGKATRLGELGRDQPKSLLEVAGRPFIDWQLERLAACGFTEAVLCIGHLGQQIREHVGDHRHLAIRYSDEGEDQLGTAGALELALPLLAGSFLVTYGDSFLSFDYARPMRLLEVDLRCDAVMSVWPETPGNVVVDGAFVEDVCDGQSDIANATDYGAIAMRRKFLERRPPYAMGLNRRLAHSAHARLLRAYLAPERYHEIGSPEGLAETERYLAP